MTINTTRRLFENDADEFWIEEDEEGNANIELEPLNDWKGALGFLVKAIHEHTNTPTAMAAGHSGLPDKASCATWQFSLITPPQMSLDSFSDTFQSNTADMGIELSLPDFHCPSLDSLLPDWFDRGQLTQDVEEEKHTDKNRDDSPEVHDTMHPDHGPDGFLRSGDSPPEHVDGPSLKDDSEDEHMDGPSLGSDSDDHEPTSTSAHAPQPQQKLLQNVRSHFMENAMTIAGAQHISNNLCHDVHINLDHWAEFWDSLKNLEGLVCDSDRLRRYAWTCLQGGPFENWEKRMLKFRGSLYEKRWREVVGFLKQLDAFLPVLAKTFDVYKYNQGFNRHGQEFRSRDQADADAGAGDEGDNASKKGRRKFSVSKLAADLKSGVY